MADASARVNRRERTILLAVFLGIGALTSGATIPSSAASAADQQTAAVPTIETVVVTARRRTEDQERSRFPSAS